MPPERTKPTKTTRTHLENKERAYIAASRRSDRSLEARVESARKASEIHKQRTGKSLRVTEQDVENEEMYEEEDGDLANMRNRAAQRQFHAQGGMGFESKLHDYIRGKVAWGDYISTLSHPGNMGINPSMYGSQNGFAGQMMPGAMQFMGQVNPSAYLPYANTDDVYQQKLSAQFIGHNPSQYLPIQHPPRSLQAPGPRMMQNMNMAMRPQWAFQGQPGMQFMPNNFNQAVFMRHELGHPQTTTDQVRNIEQQQRDILTHRMAEDARRAQMEKMKTLNSGRPSLNEPLKPSVTPKTESESSMTIKTEQPTTPSPLEKVTSSPLSAASTPAPTKSVDSKAHLQLSQNTAASEPAELGPFTSGLPADALTFNNSDFTGSDHLSEAMLYRHFPLSEDLAQEQEQQSQAQQQSGNVVFHDPFSNTHTPAYEQDFTWPHYDVGPDVDFASFLAQGNESNEVLA